MNTEIIDIYDDNGLFLKTATSKEAHTYGYWHKVIHFWIIDKKTKTLLYQKRAKKKLLYPNMLDISVAGHILSGENIFDALKRETQEELGLELDNIDITFLGIRRDSFKSSTIINREFQYIYIASIDINISTLVIQKEELSEVILISPQVIIDLFKKKRKEYIGTSYNGSIKKKVIIKIDNIIPSIDNYNYKIPLIINKLLLGENNLFI